MNNVRDWILAGKPPEQPLLQTKTRTRSAPSRAAEDENFADVPIRREALRQANHRGSARHRLDDEQVEVLHDDRSQTVTLINLSGGGAMIEGADGLKLWDCLTIRLGEFDEVVAAVRWIRGNRLGLEFAQETRIDGNRGETVKMLQAIIRRSYPDLLAEPAIVDLQNVCDDSKATESKPVDAPAREIRHPLIWSGQIHCDHSTLAVRLRNISEGGALIECGRSLKVGSELLLELDKAGSFFATVNWAHGDAAGLRFHKPFNLHKLAAARPAVAPTRWVAPDYLRQNNDANSPWSRQRGEGVDAPPRRSILR